MTTVTASLPVAGEALAVALGTEPSAAGGAIGTVDASGTAALEEGTDEGTASLPATSAATGRSGAAWTLASLRHSIHSMTATISQAKISRVRVWFIGQASSFAGRFRRG